MTTRKLDDLGRIVIPKRMRDAIKAIVGDSLVVELDKINNKITLTKYTPNCSLCNEPKDVVKFKDKLYLCNECARKVTQVKIDDD